MKIIKDILYKFALNLIMLFIDFVIKIANNEETAIQTYRFLWFFRPDIVYAHNDWVQPALLLIILMQLVICVLVAVLQPKIKTHMWISNVGVFFFALASFIVSLHLQLSTQIWHNNP